MEREKIYLHALEVRIWHWLNALGFILLILTGVQLRYIDLFNVMSFEMALKFHNYIGFFVIGNWFFWFFYHVFSNHAKNYHADIDFISFLKRLTAQLQYYAVGHFKGDPRPHNVVPFNKFNAMQKLTYLVVMFIMCPIMFLTGLMMVDTELFQPWIDFMEGIRVVNTIHVIFFIEFVFFIMIHIYMGFLGHTPLEHYKEMIKGYKID